MRRCAFVAAMVGGLVGPAWAQARLGEEVVPKEKFVVYLFIGHSNMQSAPGPHDTQVHPRGWRFDWRNRGWLPARDPLGGPAMPFVKSMVRAFADYHIGAVMCTASGASATRFMRGQSSYNQLVDAAKEIKQYATLGGLVALLGICDAGNADRANAFGENVKSIVDDLRADLDEPDLALIIGKWEEGATNRPAYRLVVRDAIYGLPKALKRTVVVDRDGPYRDGHHYTAEGHKAWAAEAVRLIGKHRLFPYAPPVQVTLTGPSPKQVFPEGTAEIPVAAKAQSDEGAITRVDFYVDGERIGRSGDAPYAVTWRRPAEGIHRLWAQAYDDKGNDSPSEKIVVAVGDVPSLLMVVGSHGLSTGEEAIKEHLEDSGYLVVCADDDEVTLADTKDRSAVLIASSSYGLVVRRFIPLPLPVVIWNDFAPELRIVAPGGGAITPRQDTLEIVDPDHPMAGGLTGTIKVSSEPHNIRWGLPTDEAAVIARIHGYQRLKAAVFGYEPGHVMPRENYKAPARRVFLFMNSWSPANFTRDGWKLVTAAIRWAAAGKDKHLPAEAIARAKYDTWPGNVDQLLYLWQAGNEPNRVPAVAGRRGRQCKAVPMGLANYGRYHDMLVTEGFFRPDEDDAFFGKAWQAAGALGVEMVITPAKAKQTGPARIVSFSAGTSRGNFTIGQEADRLTFSVRTTKTGEAPADLDLWQLSPGWPVHAIITCAPGHEDPIACYVNGRRVVNFKQLLGDFSNWSPAKLTFGAGDGGAFDWAGRIEGIALYARYIDTEEARAKYALYARKLYGRREPRAIIVHAKLTAASRALGGPKEYPRTLVMYRYEVQKVLQGLCPHKEIQVAHWSRLAGKWIPGIRDRRKGDAVELRLERFDDNPQLAREQRYSQLADHDLPMYYDIERHKAGAAPASGGGQRGAE